METLDHHDEQTLFAEVFQAALDAAEIHKVMGMIGVTEGELGQGVQASKDDIWKRVRDEHRRFQEV